MNSVTFTEPSSETRPTSLRPRSTSMTCSARSFGSATSSSAIWRSRASVAPPGRGPARAVEGRGIALVYARVGDDEQAVAQVVEDQERVREEEDRVREIEIVLGRPRQPLHVVDHVVREIAHRAALEPREPRDRHRLELPEQFSYGRERVAVGQPLRSGAALEREASVLRREDDERIGAEDRVARP